MACWAVAVASPGAFVVVARALTTPPNPRGVGGDLGRGSGTSLYSAPRACVLKSEGRYGKVRPIPR